MNYFPEITTVIIACLIGYVIGSFPTAYLLAKIKGIDIFSVGSHQAGATNVWKEISKINGIYVLVIDVTKGSTAVIFANLIGLDEPVTLLPGALAIIGHLLQNFGVVMGYHVSRAWLLPWLLTRFYRHFFYQE